MNKKTKLNQAEFAFDKYKKDKIEIIEKNLKLYLIFYQSSP